MKIYRLSYTRGTDLSGTLEGAGGIGGLLARSDGYSSGNWTSHNFYHADGNGNITYLVNSSQTLAASYRYDAYENVSVLGIVNSSLRRGFHLWVLESKTCQFLVLETQVCGERFICGYWSLDAGGERNIRLGHMGRKVRVEYPGAIYHVMNRGDRQEPIFRNDSDRVLFLETLEEACRKTDWEVHALCLMSNHFHLVVETPKANLVAGMKWLLGVYTNRFNRKHKLSGHVFSGRYKALVVDGSGNGYLRTVCDYVHLNPVRAKLLGPQEKLSAYRWSSYPEYLKRAGRRKHWLRVDRIFGELGIPRDSAAGRKEFAKRMELRRLEEEPEQWKQLRRGWCFGDRKFRQELLEQMHEKLGAEHFGEERQESSAAKAERIIAAELNRLKWNEPLLKTTRKGERGKIEMARRLREETTMTLAWIARRLHMGTRGYLTHLLYWLNRS